MKLLAILLICATFLSMTGRKEEIKKNLRQYVQMIQKRQGEIEQLRTLVHEGNGKIKLIEELEKSGEYTSE